MFCAFKRDQRKSKKTSLLAGKFWALLNGPKTKLEKKLSLLAGKFWALLNGPKTKLEKKTKSFGGKIVLRKKSCTFEWCLVLS